MSRWEYQVTTHDREALLAAAEGADLSRAPRQIFCDAEGTCFFDDAPNAYVGALVDVLNEQGDAGWELVQINFREHQMICVWRRSR